LSPESRSREDPENKGKDMEKGRIMKTWHAILVVINLAAIAGCGSPAASPTPEPEPTLIPTEGASAARSGPLVIEDGKLYVAILWHQHQPFYYQDPQTGVYEKPWVRLHAAKDYVDMAAILEEYPAIHATFNITPSLIEQLDAIGAGAKDLYQVHTEMPADELTDEQKQFLLDHFFDINPGIIARFPRYSELAQSRDADSLQTWSTEDFRDLQVLFNLAWTDPDWLALEPLASLVAKRRGYSEADKAVVLAEQLRLVREVIPLHAELQRQGQIEITTTPYAHPILPLLVDSDLASIALPEADLPTRFVYGQDAVAQVELGIESYREHFGMDPRGMWPAEGSVAENVITMISNAGIRWMASDEDVLAKSLLDFDGFTRDAQDTVQQADELYRPYAVQGARGGPVAIIFRDHLLSDKVGFEYSGTPGVEAAADFIGRLEAIRARLLEEDSSGPHLVTVLLDGENAWEYYPNDGKEFLHEMYRLLSESTDLVTVTPSEYLDALATTGVSLPELETLWAGSWIDGTFSTWIGEEEENTAWEYLRRTRAALQEAADDLDPGTLNQAMQLIYKAEGSDWFWWYGSDQNSGSDDAFDRQFRAYLDQIYRTIDLPVPDFVSVPVIPQARQLPDQDPLDLLTVTLDGVAGQDEWDNAGFYTFDEGQVAALYFGYSLEDLYLRLDLNQALTDDEIFGFYLSSPYGEARNAYSHLGSGQTQIGFGAKELIEVGVSDGEIVSEYFVADGSGGWVPGGGAPELRSGLSSDQLTLELALRFKDLYPQARSGDRINMRLVLSQGGTDLALLPPDGPALAAIPDLPISNVFLELEDPVGDDHGPGSYMYPSDGVFKPGVFDLVGLTAGYDETDLIFRLQLRGPVINEWGSPNGMSIQTVDIYVDADGPGQGARLLLPGRTAALTPDFAWDYAIWAEGWTPGVYAPGESGPVQIDSGFTITTNPGQRRITIRVPRSLLPGDPAGWSYAVAVLSQEGYPSAGVWRVRDVQLNAEQWRIGGGTGSIADTRIMDILWPEGNTPVQEQLLQNQAPQGAALADLEPDQYPQVPMVAP
jgi:alpha-amylase/alpha-mannosidase (GH57 family)